MVHDQFMDSNYRPIQNRAVQNGKDLEETFPLAEQASQTKIFAIPQVVTNEEVKMDSVFIF